MSAKATAETQSKIESLGVQFKAYPVQRNGLNPAGDLGTKRALRKAFDEIKPDCVLAYTIKPVVWGGAVLKSRPQTRFVALITGLGYAFQGQSMPRRLLRRLVIRLYRNSLKQAQAVIFQNSDNRDTFLNHGIVSADKCHVVAGSGINLERFPQSDLPTGPPRFLLIARLLGEKGIREYARAARIVLEKYPQTRFSLVGPEDPSPDGIPIEEVNQWHQERTLFYHGPTDDVRSFLNDCHVYVLPSYHEGMPRTVLEALAVGRPILTTDVCGCKETVEPGVNGWLVPHADHEALADRMIWFIENRDQWHEMGNASRKLAEDRFDVRIVNEEMMKILMG